MAGRTKHRVGDQLGKWVLVKYLDTGGNGDVWRVSDGESDSAVMKILHKEGKKDYERFCREVAICQRLDAPDVAILPVWDSHLPDRPTASDRPWFVMPFAEGLMKALASRPLVDKMTAIRDIASTLALLLRTEGLHHRDIKPENLFLYEGRAVIGDFGLARRPDDPNLTEGKPLGPFHHLPSEVFLDENPDWEAVDVYCLANSLWRIAAEKPYPPRGQIRSNEDDSLSVLLRDEPYVGRLASLIEASTARSPTSRPTLSSFADQLTEWIASRETRDDFAVQFEQAESRSLAVLRWIIAHVRREPVFDEGIFYDVADPEAASEIAGLNEAQVGEALFDLIENAFVWGEPSYVLGRADPRSYEHVYPTLLGVAQGADVDALTHECIPLLQRFVTPVDFVSLPRSNEPTEVRDGFFRIPGEAYFQMRLLSDQGFLDFKPLNEMGGHASFMDVRATSGGKRWLYEMTRAKE